MKTKLFLAIISTIVLFSCDDDNANENVVHEALKERFNGKYEIIEATSATPVDLNMDGEGSTNLLNENPAILNAQIELRINENSNLYSDLWPVEDIMATVEEFDSTTYYPTYVINYALFVLGNRFHFVENYTAIELINREPAFNRGTADPRVVFPDSIKIEEDGIITVISTRNIFTFNGYMTVEIVAKYRRYTKIT